MDYGPRLKGHLTLSKSSGWVQQAAPALARPPKYHRPMRFVEGESAGMIN